MHDDWVVIFLPALLAGGLESWCFEPQSSPDKATLTKWFVPSVLDYAVAPRLALL